MGGQSPGLRALCSWAAAWWLAAASGLLPWMGSPCLTACGSTACQSADQGGQLALCCATQCSYVLLPCRALALCCALQRNTVLLPCRSALGDRQP